MTVVYLSEISRYDGRISLLEEGMSDDILTHCKRHQNEQDYQASLLAFNVLNQALKQQGIDVNTYSLSYQENNKPYFPNMPYHFNISHSGDIVAVCISNFEVGIDVELIATTRDFDALASRYFGKREKEDYHHAIDKIETFYKTWTKKEAFHKHVGDGFSLDTFAKDLPYGDIYTTKLSDNAGRMYSLSVDSIDNERINIMVI